MRQSHAALKQNAGKKERVMTTVEIK